MTDLAGKHVLVLEDEWFIATELCRVLSTNGAVVVGPAPDLAAGLDLAERPLDAAALDVDLDGAMSFPVANRLAARGVPFLFVTGYDGWAFPDRLRAAPRITKPFSHRRVVQAIAALLGGDAA